MSKKKADVLEVAEAAEVVEVQEPIVVQEKYVKVTPKISGQRFIAGQWYEFTMDKEIEVTQEAKRVLKEAKAIYI
jgi:hypothetical protein